MVPGRSSRLAAAIALPGMGVPVLLAGLASALPAQTYPAADHGGNYMHNYYLPPAPNSTPWAPTWHPDGDRIAVAMSGSIWSVEERAREAGR